jgi:hypothetical protein
MLKPTVWVKKTGSKHEEPELRRGVDDADHAADGRSRHAPRDRDAQQHGPERILACRRQSAASGGFVRAEQGDQAAQNDQS